MAVSDHASASRTALRFSLRAMLIAVLLVALCAVVWVAQRKSEENRKLHTENSRLKAETGELAIEPGTEDKLQAIHLPTSEPMTWKWRVYIPSGRQFWIQHLVDGVSDDNLPDRGSGCTLQPGNQLLTVALRKNESNGQWDWVIQCGGVSCGPHLSSEKSQWISKPSQQVIRSGIAGGRQTIVERGKPLEVFRYRRFPLEMTGPLTGPAEGILIWIREARPEN